MALGVGRVYPMARWHAADSSMPRDPRRWDIVEDLLEHAKKSSNHVIVYAYCSYKRQHEQTFSNLIATLLRQFLLQLPAVPDDFRKLYECHTNASSRPNIDKNELRSLLYSATETCAKVFIVIDALDECTDDVRGELLSELFELQTKSNIDVSFLATTRYMKNILEQFEDCTELEILANEPDIGQSLGSQMRRLAPCVARNAELQELIKTRVISAAEGMFLLAQLHFDSLTDKTTPKSIKSALDSMQIGSDALNNAYKNTVERIQAQQTGFRDLAHKVLSWITYAVRPLTVKELQHALAVSLGDTKIDEEHIEDEEPMVSVCAGLVTVDASGKSNVIRFVHYTTQAYYEDAGKEWLPSVHFDIARSCIAYLSLENFSFGTCSTYEQLKSLMTQNAFLEYAAQNWGWHVSYVEAQIIEDAESPLMPFLMKEDNINCAAQVRQGAVYYRNGVMVQPRVTPLHLLTCFGLRESINLFLNNNHHPNDRNELGETPLSWAATEGHEIVVKLLLDRADVETDPRDLFGQTPLSKAAKHDINVNSLGNYGTPLSEAAFRGHVEVVVLLLTNPDVDVNIQNFQGHTALFRAIRGEAIMGNNEDTVRLLLTRGDLDINLSDELGETPLILAMYHGLEDIVRLLLTRDDLDINFSGQELSSTA
ncbi:hypothetical protein EPUS_09501 [Endocarpon pusillum Z07020]|uniref:Uncharacterized protein n=1 Tax=Endocarpon pusillum (strain Z07020 / HMAS-L-300199) TaxID=1263415 RepID=U1FWL3_ENDPU|nr:uncharacterized protein EPUS_09501 [Endocarpon pusillum Z07020]ERF69237.1 hypothetical protein EPUS_09501 [Endocarpon pusillum Z07020]